MNPYSFQSLVQGPATVKGTTKSSGSQYQSLQRAIEKTRLEIKNYQKSADRLQNQFDEIIRPLEQFMTALVLKLTHQLIDHHDQSVLEASDKSLLGLWVSENIASLTNHPFANASSSRVLAERWRESLRNEASGLSAIPYGIDGSQFEMNNHDVLQKQKPREELKRNSVEKEQTRVHKADQESKNSETDDSRAPDGSDKKTMGKQNSESDGCEQTQTLIRHLFRQLATILHPDKEPDEHRKQNKDELMRLCLKARRENDLATLLSLYHEHANTLEIPDSVKPENLIRTLKTQLRLLQAQLRALHRANPMQRLIMERYSGLNEQDTNARFARHARSLNREIESLGKLQTSLATLAGLAEALQGRREKLLDRMAINEMTGY